jgi:hypothetical protein
MPVYHLVLEHQLTVQSSGADHRVQSVAQDRNKIVTYIEHAEIYEEYKIWRGKA